MEASVVSTLFVRVLRAEIGGVREKIDGLDRRIDGLDRRMDGVDRDVRALVTHMFGLDRG
jgi:hypothetical protein